MSRFFLNGATGFAGYERFLKEGADAIRPVLVQRAQLGFNATRTWTAYDIPKIGRLIPREWPEFYARMPEFCSLCAEHGQYPYWTVYAGADSNTLGSHQDMVDHQHRIEDALEPVGYALIDQHNEQDHAANEPSDFETPPSPSTLIWSRGSNMQDTNPPTPLGRFYAWHVGGSEWQRKVGKQSYDYQRDTPVSIPGVDDETTRVEPGGETSTIHCHDAGAMGALFVAGAFFHSAEAKLFQPFSGPELDCAEAWCQGVQSIVAQGLDIAQDGQYIHRDDLETPGIIRAYEKRLGNRSIILKVRA